MEKLRETLVHINTPCPEMPMADFLMSETGTPGHILLPQEFDDLMAQEVSHVLA